MEQDVTANVVEKDTQDTSVHHEEPQKNMADNAEAILKLKNALSKANSEAADYKRQLRERLSEQEKAEAERKEAEQALQAELNELRREKTVANYLTKLMESGIDAELAANMANKLPDGVPDEFFTAQKTFLENKTKSIQAEALKSQPGLTPGTPPTAKQIEDAEIAKYRKWAGLK